MSANVFDVLKERGFVQQVTDEAAVRDMLGAGPVVAYCGFDPTADSLHAGSLLPLMALMHLERAGHRPIVLFGGGTAMVGDPSGKTEMRPMAEAERIQANLVAIKEQVSRFFDFEHKTLAVDNGEWLLALAYIPFLRDIGRHFSVNRMLAAESYKIRLERGLSFIEFNYQILQAYDFLELYRRHQCLLQLGGDDQWGNILAGVDLVRRITQVTAQGLTFPLLTTATGEKMGKTASGAVWLSADKLAPYEFYQYFVNCHDADVTRLLGYFSFLPMAEVRETAKLENAELNMAKSILAYEITAIVHGKAEADKAHAAAQAAFGSRVIPAHLLPSSSVARSAKADESAMPTLLLTAEEAEGGLSAAALVIKAGLASSNRQARTQLTQGQFKLDGETIAEKYGFEKLPSDTFDRPRTLQQGKKKVIVRR